MKKIIVIALVLMGSMVYSAAPANNSAMNAVVATTTISADHSGIAWTLLDSIIIIKTDTCYTVYTISGVAVMGFDDRCYLGFARSDTRTPGGPHCWA